ncbi:MAG: RNA polymerase sigma factor [Planctomycetia bacterium]
MSAGGESHGWVMEAVDVYELPLLRYARRILGDVDLAADAVQHAFVKLCEESQERLEGRVAPWLFRVCRNRALDHLRQSGRERSLLGEGDIAAPTEGQPASRETDPALAVERADLAARLRELLKDLPAPQRETIDLWCEGLTYRQIAEVTGRQEGHVRVLAHRGLTSLRMHPLIRDLLQTDGSPTAAQAPTS